LDETQNKMSLEHIERAGQVKSGEPSQPLPWFALQVRTRFERAVAEHLAGKGYEWFLPLYKDKKQWSDRIKQLDSPLFPGYLFCRFDVQRRLPILQTPGVIQIVGYNRQPISVAESEITAIQKLVSSGMPNQPCSFVEIGERVQIESGPLRGLEGILVESRGRQKFVLSVSLLQRSVAVEIAATAVTAVRSTKALPAELRRELTLAVA
jgi:transcription antitermination factor NusG